MQTREFRDYRVQLEWDTETQQFIASVPTLGISDYAAEAMQAIQNLREMIEFHLECLQEENRSIPEDSTFDEGVFVRVRIRQHAA